MRFFHGNRAVPTLTQGESRHSEDLIVESGGGELYNGDTAHNTQVRTDSLFNINYGAVNSAARISSGGLIRVNGGTHSGSTILFGDSRVIRQGGSSTGGRVESYGCRIVRAGGGADNTPVSGYFESPDAQYTFS